MELFSDESALTHNVSVIFEFATFPTLRRCELVRDGSRPPPFAALGLLHSFFSDSFPGGA